MNIILVGVNGALNSGDQTLCSATLRLLREIYPGAHLSGVHRNPDLQARHFPDVEWLPQIGASFSNNTIRRRFTNLHGLGTTAVHVALRSSSGAALPAAWRHTYQSIARADLVVGCAGGWLEDHYVSIWTNLIHLSIATNNHVPVFIAPQSIGPFRHMLSRRLAGRVLRNAAGVAAREEISQGYARDLEVPEKKLRVFPDLALFEQEADYAEADELIDRLCGPNIPPMTGTTLMPWSFPGSSNPSLELERYLDKVAATAKLVFQQSGLKTLFLRQIRDDKGHCGDGNLVRRVGEAAGECAIVCPDYLEPGVLRGIISRCQAFWGTRLHSNIFAATQRVPVVAIAYQHKATGIMKMLGMSEYVVNIDDFQPESLARLIVDAAGRKEEWRQVLNRRFAELEPEWGHLKSFMIEAVSHFKQ